ncbi:MAG: SPFH domain-containing protein [Candidatus Eisenbacteria bacterium]|uniref:SPFH domain-containing protein n=1 Tax=Eiseniibacteriota bacterium TaxID=2212470 RepID=A0A956SDR7_UNCEI|nr:SPFH domain-containing protein [Candidatus Eisenbacteria bacterium]MCB9463460.1 SPFH domain-containing protein [Candidatus Eisenbacteria bacterium]
MGFVQKLRNELIDIVEWVDDSRHTLVWRFPRYHNQIKNGAQLVVRPGQTAVFVHQGKIADIFHPGQYELETKNLPILSTLQGWKYGFDSPFKAEVYFCSSRQIPDLKWGTPTPVMLRDTDFGPVRLRAYGTYTLKAEDPAILLSELVGTDSEFDAEEITVLLRSIINNCFADLIAASRISILDLASNYGQLSEDLRSRVIERIDDEYGLDIPSLYIVNFSLPEEVQRALDARSSMGILGDLGRFQQYQIGAAMPIAAENPAGGVAGAGVGLGMGLAISQQFGAGPQTVIPGGAPGGPGGSPGGGIPGGPGGGTSTGTSGSGAGLQVVPQAPVGTPATGWYLAEGGRTEGPFDYSKLAELAQLGRLRPNSLVWVAGMAGWVEAAQVRPLLALFQPPPAPPAPETGPPPVPPQR